MDHEKNIFYESLLSCVKDIILSSNRTKIESELKGFRKQLVSLTKVYLLMILNPQEPTPSPHPPPQHT